MRTTLASYLDDFLDRADDIAYVSCNHLRPERRTYRWIAERAYQTARELSARNISRGDRVLIRGENSPEWVAAFFGCLVRGVVAVPLDDRAAPDFLDRVQSQVNAKLAFVDVPTGGPEIILPRLSETVSHHPASPVREPDLGPDDLVEIIFTSGTTAHPKGICLTHRNILTNLLPIETEIRKYLHFKRPFHPIRFLDLVPLSHVFGQFMGIFIPQLLSGTVLFQRSTGPTGVANTILRERVSVLIAVPRMLETLRDWIERGWERDGRRGRFHASLERAKTGHFLKRWWLFRSVHRRFGWKFWACISGGASLDEATEEFWRRLGYAVIQGYGMTETASLITVAHPFKLSRGSIGKSLPGRELSIDQTGEILVRGENVAAGRWDDGIRPLVGEDGWLRTGDVGERDAAGNYFFRGRKKDTIVTPAGLNVHPEDLEAALNAQPEVRSSAVVAVSGPRGPEPCAVLLLRDPTADVRKIVERANRNLGEYQHIRRWFVWPNREFPRTTTQKIRKRDILAVVERGESASPSNGPAGTDDLAILVGLVRTITGRAPEQVTSASTLSEDLRLDSLGRVELMSALEDRYQIELDERAFTAATTVGDILAHLGAGPLSATETTPSVPSTSEGGGSYPFPEWALAGWINALRCLLLYGIVLPVTFLLGAIRVKGAENLRNQPGPVLLVANHVSIADQALILAALPGSFRRRLAVAMDGERLRDFRFPPPGTGLPGRLLGRLQYFSIVLFFNVFPMPQRSGFRSSFTYAGRAAERGYNVLVFPEGRRSTEGGMGTFRDGIGLLAAQLDIPVVPIQIGGLYELKAEWNAGARRLPVAPRGALTVTIGVPLRFSRDDNPETIARTLERAVRDLSNLAE